MIIVRYNETTAVTQAPGASLQGEDPDCGGVAAAHYEVVGTPRPACHR